MSERKRMSLHIPDYLADTADLDAASSGAYLHLIMHYWMHGGLPQADRDLAQIAKVSPYKWKFLHQRLSKFFEPGWRHKRIEKEIQRADDLRERLERAGVVGRAKQRNMARAWPRHPLKERITTTETVAARSKEGASRGSKGNGTLEPTPELIETMDRKDRKH